MINDPKRIKMLNTSLEYDTAFQTTKWCDAIPAITFKEDWQVKIIPPFGGSVVRFLVSKKGMKDRVSVYLDGYSMLGYSEDPYWEVYPYEGDTFRCSMNETNKLVKAIDKSLKKIENDNNHKRGSKVRKKKIIRPRKRRNNFVLRFHHRKNEL